MAAVAPVAYGWRAMESFNHPVGTDQQRLRNLQPQRLRRLAVDHQLEPGRLPDRKIGRLAALKIRSFLEIVYAAPDSIGLLNSFF